MYFKEQACYMMTQSHRRCVSKAFVVYTSSWHDAAWKHKAHLNIQKHIVWLVFTAGWPWVECPPHTENHCVDWTSRWPPASARPPSNERWNPTAADCCGRWQPGKIKQHMECLLLHFRWINRKIVKKWINELNKNKETKKTRSIFIIISWILAFFFQHKGKGQRLLCKYPSWHMNRRRALGSTHSALNPGKLTLHS